MLLKRRKASHLFNFRSIPATLTESNQKKLLLGLRLSVYNTISILSYPDDPPIHSSIHPFILFYNQQNSYYALRCISFLPSLFSLTPSPHPISLFPTSASTFYSRISSRAATSIDFFCLFVLLFFLRLSHKQGKARGIDRIGLECTFHHPSAEFARCILDNRSIKTRGISWRMCELTFMK